MRRAVSWWRALPTWQSQRAAMPGSVRVRWSDALDVTAPRARCRRRAAARERELDRIRRTGGGVRSDVGAHAGAAGLALSIAARRRHARRLDQPGRLRPGI